MLPKKELHTYWRNPDETNHPSTYVAPGTNTRSDYLLHIIANITHDKNASILEVGCNAGRNLNYLWVNGYHKLTGVEINPAAVALARTTFPDMKATIHTCTAEEIIPVMGYKLFDIVFTMAVLEHISVESEFLFQEIVNVCKKNIVTIEDEEHNTYRHTARDYGKIFTAYGMNMIFAERTPEDLGMGSGFVTRVFEK